jgi:hypothetical protein
MPATSAAQLGAGGATFRFDCLNVFATGPVDGPFPDALPMQRDVRIRFLARIAGTDGRGDSLLLLRESEVTPGGAVHEHDMPADVPMFEQLVDAEGRILRSSMGPAHVPGFNATPWGSGTHCVGCHAGHSALPVAASYKSGKYTNASPSARVTASGSAPGSSPRAVADRRTRGAAPEVAWIGATPGDSLSLEWRWPIEVREVVLYAVRHDRATRTDLTLGGCELTLLRQGREVGRRAVRGPLRPEGTRVAIDDVAVDELRVRPLAPRGRVAGIATTGLAEVETLARLVEE